MTRRFIALALTLGLLAPWHGIADTMITVDSLRIVLGDVLPDAPSEAKQADLGRAPPPGGVRTLSRAEVVRRLRALGLGQQNLQIPRLLRVKSASRKLSATELEALAREALSDVLMEGVSIQNVRSMRSLVVSPNARAIPPKTPSLPHRAGPFKTTLSLPFAHEGEVVDRATLSVTLHISEEAAKPLIEKGSLVTLVIDRNGARISAKGVAMGDGYFGEVQSFQVQRTRKMLRARISSRYSAEVVFK